jgi:hypothetical protein
MGIGGSRPQYDQKTDRDGLGTGPGKGFIPANTLIKGTLPVSPPFYASLIFSLSIEKGLSRNYFLGSPFF